MYLILWRFKPNPDRERDFESAYGPNGAWAQLFRRGEGYLGTQLLKPRDAAGHYLTVDRWRDEQAYWLFRQQHHDAYSALDVLTSELTAAEELIGQFDAIAEP